MKNYSVVIEVAKTAKDVFNAINNVSKWWAAEFNGNKSEITGQSKNLNDEFAMRFGDLHYSKQKLIEFIPNKKVVWLVVESRINWIENNKEEWTGMKMIFEIVPKGDKTILTFTQEGLAPEKECFANCSKSWDMFIKQSLFNYINDN